MPAGAKLPVMVWWHGGGYTSGSGVAYDAQRLASAGYVMVVTANKRLGICGHLRLPGLPGGGDFGFADQLAAVRWAKTNARAFGGDPGNLTVFGESDGAMAACALLTSPAAPAWPQLSGNRVQQLAPGAIRPVDISAEHRCSFCQHVHAR